MFYESINSPHGELLKTECGTDFSFPSHLHGSFELITVTEGEMVVAIDKNQYALTPGQAVLIFPNQVHSLHTNSHSCHRLFIFSPRLVQRYSNAFLGKLPLCSRFSPTAFYLDELLSALTSGQILKAKGVLYCLCAEFDNGTVYQDKNAESGNLLQQIFAFVENNYRTDCSLEALAAHTSYHAAYLSRYFKQSTGLAFTDHVNRYRVSEAAYMLKNSDRKVLDIAYDCGYESLRSFNRNFKAIMGIPPKEYRLK